MSDVMYDYVSPGFERLDPSAAFPEMTEGEPRGLIIDGVTSVDPHRWYYDKRWPPTGFINCDEAHLLYALAKQFAGKTALEIGCLSGYSAWHLLKAGLRLVICDPLLHTADRREAVHQSLEEFGGKYAFIGIPSPEGVRGAGLATEPWSFVFIDGNHDAPQPLIDAAIARHFCTADAMIVFHDAVLLSVFEAMVMLVAMGWKARIYHTSQVIGCCWRGDIAPVVHVSDPAIASRHMPNYLSMFEPKTEGRKEVSNGV